MSWGHHRDVGTVPDTVMQRMDLGIVSFVFSCKACSPGPQPHRRSSSALTLPRPDNDAGAHKFACLNGVFPQSGRC